MTDPSHHWVFNKAQKVIYNSAAPSTCLSTFGADDKLRMLPCNQGENKWKMMHALIAIDPKGDTPWTPQMNNNAVTVVTKYVSPLKLPRPTIFKEKWGYCCDVSAGCSFKRRCILED